MQDLIASIPVLLVTLIVVVAIFLFTGRAKKEKEKGLAQLALERGWTFEPFGEPLAWGFRLKGQQWVYEVFSRSGGPALESGSSNVSQSTLWRTESLSLPGRLVLIAPLPQGDSVPGAGSLAKQQVLYLFSGEQASGLAESVLYQRYLCLAYDPADYRTLITSQAEQNLKSWGGPAFKLCYSSQGLQIEIPDQRVEKPLEISALVELGESFLER